MNAEILIIDDDRELGDMLREFLAPEHFKVSACTSGEQGLETLRAGHYDLLILDIMLPGMSGMDVLREIRKDSDTPVIMLTARGDDIDRILGLEFGADDYLSKPFNPRELLARIKAILRRAQSSGAQGHRLSAGVVDLDTRARHMLINGEPVRLTGTEFEILRSLMAAPGEVVSRDQLCREALGRRLLPYDRSIDTHISNVRRKLEQMGVTSPTIQNQRGIGYRLLMDE